MKILALEFSSAQRSVAVVNQSKGHSGLEVAEVIETGGRTAKPFEMVEQALRQARLEREQIECLAVGLGPGSYNGIRSAIAIAQGWQIAAGAKVLGISTVDCLVDQVRQEQPGWSGRVHMAIDAQRGEFYLASFEYLSGQPTPVSSLRIVSRNEIEALQKAGEAIAGPELSRYFPDGRDLFPRATVLGRLALTRWDFVSGDKLEPIYLRETTFVKAPPPRRIN